MSRIVHILHTFRTAIRGEICKYCRRGHLRPRSLLRIPTVFAKSLLDLEIVDIEIPHCGPLWRAVTRQLYTEFPFIFTGFLTASLIIIQGYIHSGHRKFPVTLRNTWYYSEMGSFCHFYTFQDSLFLPRQIASIIEIPDDDCVFCRTYRRSNF